MFFTWNDSQNDLYSLIENINTKHQILPLQLTISIGLKIKYLDCVLNNNNGHLETYVHHETTIEPYALPYLSNHPTHMYSTYILTSLIRAAQCCTSVYDFEEERKIIELACALNRFPTSYISQQIEQFFFQFQIDELNLNYNQDRYDELRQHVFENDQQQTMWRRIQRRNLSNQIVWYIECPLDGDELNIAKRHTRSIWNLFRRQHPRFIETTLNLLGHPKYPSYTK